VAKRKGPDAEEFSDWWLLHYSIYSFAFACAFFNTGSIFVAFMTSPVSFSLPAMNNRCAWVLPLVSLPKSSSDNERVTIMLRQYDLLENAAEVAMIERCVG